MSRKFEKLFLALEDLAQQVDVSRQTISAIEKGNYNPSVNLCIKICQALDKTLDDPFLAGGVNNMENVKELKAQLVNAKQKVADDSAAVALIKHALSNLEPLIK